MCLRRYISVEHGIFAEQNGLGWSRGLYSPARAAWFLGHAVPGPCESLLYTQASYRRTTRYYGMC